jgi:ribosomal-protein-alanine N-acetyltransferase
MLETERLILRRFTAEDAEPMFRNWASDTEVTRFLMWQTHPDIEVSKYITNDWVNNYKSDSYYQWAIVPKDLGEPIGSIGAVKVDDATEMVHIGYCIGKAWWHKGYTSEALTRLIKFFFEEVGINRIEARHDPRNPNSGAVMMKAGLKFEGTLRQSDRNNQGICDASYYAILAEDYFGKLPEEREKIRNEYEKGNI